MVDVVDHATHILYKPDPSFEGGALGERQPIALVYRPLIVFEPFHLVGKVSIQFGDCKFLSMRRDFANEFDVLVLNSLERLLEALDSCPQFREPLIVSRISVCGGACEQGDAEQDVESYGSEIS